MKQVSSLIPEMGNSNSGSELTPELPNFSLGVGVELDWKILIAVGVGVELDRQNLIVVGVGVELFFSSFFQLQTNSDSFGRQIFTLQAWEVTDTPERDRKQYTHVLLLDEIVFIELCV
jgi:hypothetical protein